MAWVESMQEAINFMEENLLEEMSIERIARNANSSSFHFQRTFSILTDSSVADYIRRRRLTLAGHDLLNTDAKIIDLAYKYGYDTPEAFSKAFRRQHGITPSDARKGNGMLKSYNRLVIQVNLKGADPMRFRIEEKEAFQVIGIKREFSLENEGNLIGIPKLWDRVNSDGTVQLVDTLNNGDLKGILGVCVHESVQTKKMDYWIAAHHIGDGKEGLLHLEIPASKWAVFEVRGPMPHAMQNTWKQIFSEWFPSSGYKHAGTAEFELYTDDDPFHPDCYSEIWIPIQQEGR